MRLQTPPDYRADVDGLRAVAIAGVVAFHYDLGPISGGYTGVDVFFVISGYLIAKIVSHETALGQFRPVRFYERRLRRILPALLVMLAATALSSTRLLPNDLKTIGLSFINAAAFTSNFFFANLAQDYFSAGELATQPALHTWSLAVEAQFYLILPWLWLMAGRVPNGRLYGLVALGILSFGVSIWGVAVRPQPTFYLLPGRFWEFMAGASLVLVRLPVFGAGVAAGLVGLGLGLIGTGYLALSNATPFPGFAALLPCVGAALILAGGGVENPASRLLGKVPLAALGRVSYGLYLWHWPLLVLAGYGRIAPLPLSERLALLALAVALAALSWVLIERPVIARRRLRGWGRLAFACGAGTVSVLALGLALNLAGQNKLGFAQLPPAVLTLANGQFDHVDGDCYPGDGLREAICRFGHPTADPSVAVWGNSFAQMWQPALDAEARRAGAAGVALILRRCPPIVGTALPKAKGCTGFNREALAYLSAHPGLRTVVLGGNWSLWLADLPALERTLAALSDLGRRVVLIGEPPQLPFAAPRTLALAALRSEGAPPVVSERSARDAKSKTAEVLSRLVAAHGVTFIDPFDAFCDGRTCAIERDGHALYSDDAHLTAYGARLFSGILAPIFTAPVPHETSGPATGAR